MEKSMEPETVADGNGSSFVPVWNWLQTPEQIPFEYYRSIRNTQYVIWLRYVRILNIEKENIYIDIYTIRNAVYTLIYVYI